MSLTYNILLQIALSFTMHSGPVTPIPHHAHFSSDRAICSLALASALEKVCMHSEEGLCQHRSPPNALVLPQSMTRLVRQSTHGHSRGPSPAL